MAKRAAHFRIPVLLFAVCLFASVGFAQEAPPVKLPSFDVVSVKPNKTGSGATSINMSPDHFKMSNVTLLMLIENAWGLKREQISGLPGWAESEHFDLEGKVLDADLVALKKLTYQQRRPMFQAMVAERFALKTHSETKVLSIYELTVAKEEPKFKEAGGEADEKSNPKYENLGRGGMMTQNDDSVVEMTAHAVSILDLVAMLGNQVHRVVVDKTGLKGKYNLALRWAPEDGSSAPPDSGKTFEPPPSIFTAVQEQLGLKMTSTKGPVETMAVDHVEQPSEN